MRKTILPIAALMTLLPLHAVEAASLRGSPASMQQQNGVAVAHGLDFYRTVDEIHAAVAGGDLLRLEGNADYEVADFVSFPVLRPEVHLFVERLASQYRAACGEKLVVTSATRPSGNQPRNSHALSVHPAGMAVDLRVSQNAQCRSWLESALLNMERQGLLNGIREFHPPHYHVAVFPRQYAAYFEERMAEERAERKVQMAKAMRTLDAIAMLHAPPSVAGVEDGRLGASEILGIARPVGFLPLAFSFVSRLFRTT